MNNLCHCPNPVLYSRDGRSYRCDQCNRWWDETEWRIIYRPSTASGLGPESDASITITTEPPSMNPLNRLIRENIRNSTIEDLSRRALRYDVLRALDPQDVADLWGQHMAVEDRDVMADCLVLAGTAKSELAQPNPVVKEEVKARQVQPGVDIFSDPPPMNPTESPINSSGESLFYVRKQARESSQASPEPGPDPESSKSGSTSQNR